MHVDEAGRDVRAVGVDDPPAAVLELADRDDAVVVDRDVGAYAARFRCRRRPCHRVITRSWVIVPHLRVAPGRHGCSLAQITAAATTPRATREYASGMDLAGVDAVEAGLREHDYLADEGLATSIFLALRLQRPLLLEGEAGVGKTEVAKVLARWTGGELLRLQCYEGIDASQAVYEWDYSRQLLHLRAVEASGAEVVEDELYSKRFLVERPLLAAIAHTGTTPPVLLVDEVDRADDEFEAFLLEILSDWSISVPELGLIRAAVPPIAVLTSNRTRDVHDALKRRCLYHWIAHPDFERELAILRVRAPGGTRPAGARRRGRSGGDARLRAVQASRRRGDDRLGAGARDARHRATSTSTRCDVTLGTILKYREDQERLRDHGVDELVRTAVARSA